MLKYPQEQTAGVPKKGGMNAAGTGRESCQAGNRAALNGTRLVQP